MSMPMEPMMSNFGEMLKQELLRLWESGALRAVKVIIEEHLPELKKRNLKASLGINLRIYHRDKEFAIDYIPLASIVTATGATGRFASEISKWEDRLKTGSAAIDDAELTPLAEQFKSGLNNPSYKIHFGIKPSPPSLSKRFSTCTHCHGDGYVIE